MPSFGTRSRQSFAKERVDQGEQTRTDTRDSGLSKNVSGIAITFNAGTAKATAANGTFANFVAGDEILIGATNLNNGYKRVTAIDGVNQSFLTLDPPPATEGPLNATIRSR